MGTSRMRLATVALAVVGLIVATSASAAPHARTHAAGVRFTFVTPRVTPGGIATFRVAGTPSTSCSLLLTEPSGGPINLPLRTLKGGRASWSYRVAPNAPTGTWTATAICTSGHAAKKFAVGALVQPAQVVVSKSGFTQDTSGGGNVTSYGLALTNTSTVSDALNVGVTVTFVDTLGRSVTSDQTTISFIPAGATFYLSGGGGANVSLSVASLQISVKVGSSAPKRLALPTTQNVQMVTDGFGLKSLAGNLTNPYSQPLPEDATIYIVEFDSNGNIIGGDQLDTGALIEPGATVGWSWPFLSDAVASVQTSVDPCPFFFDPNQCPAFSK